MKFKTGFVQDEASEDLSCPAKFRGFFNAKWNLEGSLSIQDPLHLVVKIIWKLMRCAMIIGDYRASKSCVLDVLYKHGKHVTGIDPSIITNVKDAMNYERAEKLCCSKLLEKFNEESHRGTRAYLKLARSVNIALVETQHSPECCVESGGSAHSRKGQKHLEAIFLLPTLTHVSR